MSIDRPLIYIVDDSADYRFFVSQVFKRYLTEYRVEYFESGTALCAHLSPEPLELPCLILMDHQMPGLSGPQTIAMLKHQAIWKEIPMIIISSSLSAEDQQMAYDSGADSYRQKPITILQLKEELAQLCQDWIK
jgi:CheY-like chemotaxis protein